MKPTAGFSDARRAALAPSSRRPRPQIPRTLQADELCAIFADYGEVRSPRVA
jgi:hypothetical protein